MSDATHTAKLPVLRRFRFSIGTFLLWIAIGALSMNKIITNRHVTQLEQEVTQLKQDLASQQPLPPKEVARQFEKRTTRGTITTTVKDVRYSPEADACKVNFSWADSASGNAWHSDVRLTHDGFGRYYGQIKNPLFVQALGHKESFAIAVETPSSFDD